MFSSIMDLYKCVNWSVLHFCHVVDKKKKKKRAKKEEDEDRLFPVQRGPKETDTVPECVKLLEEVIASQIPHHSRQCCKITNFESHHTEKTQKCINLPKPLLITCEVSSIVYLIDCVKCVQTIHWSNWETLPKLYL